MPQGRGTRVIAEQLLEANAEEIDCHNSTSKPPKAQEDGRSARLATREAVKLSHSREHRESAVSARLGPVQPIDENGHEEEDENEDEEGDLYGFDHDHIAQAINQARNRAVKLTINGIGARQVYQAQKITEASDDREANEEALSVSRSLDCEESVVNLQHVHEGSSKPRELEGKQQGIAKGACVSAYAGSKILFHSSGTWNSNPPQQENQQSYTSSVSPVQDDEEGTSDSGDISELQSESEVVIAADEDLALVEAPRRNEEPAKVEVSINSLGGIFKTLQHKAWTGTTGWTSRFQSKDNDDIYKCCETVSGKALMIEIQGLNNILGEATHTSQGSLEDENHSPQGSWEDEHYFAITIECLRLSSVNIQQHLARINQIIDNICSRKLSPPPPDASDHLTEQAIKKRRALLQDISRQLIPMLIITIKKACEICPSENRQSKTTLYLDCFTLQFFLRPLAWVTRLQKALKRGLEQWHCESEPQNDADDPDGSEEKARSAFEHKLGSLFYAVEKAESKIQDIAALRQRHESEAKNWRLNQQHIMERQRSIAASKLRVEEERRRRDAKQFEAFIASTQSLRDFSDPLKQLWEQDQAALEQPFPAASTQEVLPRGNPSLHGQRTSTTAASEGYYSRYARAEDATSNSDDPFADKGGEPFPDWAARSNQLSQNQSTSSGGSRKTPHKSRSWSLVEEKTIIREIRYKRTYSAVSVAQRLGRSQADVARKAALLRQGYREAYTERGEEIPAWAL